MLRILFISNGNNNIKDSRIFEMIGDSYFNSMCEDFKKVLNGKFAGYISSTYSFEPAWQYIFENHESYNNFILCFLKEREIPGYRSIVYEKQNNNEILIKK